MNDLGLVDATAPARDTSSASASAPGKSTLTSRLPRGHDAAPAPEAAAAPSAPPSMDAVFGLHLGDALPHRTAMEAAFDRDFVGVGVSLGARDALATHGADAMAAGERVAFADASPSPWLVAHELTHVVQQRNAGVDAPAAKATVAGIDSAAEREADAVADRVVRGESVGDISAQPSAVYRHAKEPGGSLDQATPAGAHVTDLFASARIEPVRRISENLASGPEGSRVDATLTRTELTLRFTPPLRTMKSGIPTADLAGITYGFRGGEIDVDARGLTGDAVADTVRARVRELLRGSGFDRRPYDPFADPQVGERARALVAALGSGPAFEAPAPFRATGKDVHDAQVGAHLRIDAQIDARDSEGTGVVIPAGTSATVSATANDGEQGPSGLRRVSIALDATAYREGQPVACIRAVTITPGGHCALDQFELLGGARSAAAYETVGRFALGAGRASSLGAPDPLAAAAGAADAAPTTITGAVRRTIEERCEAALRRAVDQSNVQLGDTSLRQLMGM